MNDQNTLTLEYREPGIAILWMDDKEARFNTLKTSLMGEFETLLDELEGKKDVNTLVFMSGKPDSFIVGADISILKSVQNAEYAAQLADHLHVITARLQALPVTSVAAINGSCLGGGLELALAFDYRIASNHPETRLGLPEVQLGLLPGGGGTQRLPALIGLEKGLDMLLTGRALNASRALKAGLVDDVVAPDILLDVAIGFGAKGERQPRSRWSVKGLRRRLLSDNPLGRRLVFKMAREKAQRTTKGNYPAPEKILQVVEDGLEHGFEHGLIAEARAFGELVVSPQAEQLMNLFFATTDLKKDLGVDDESVEARPIDKVGVLGAGLMGAGIAYVSAVKAGVPVRLKDVANASLGKGLAHIAGLLDKRVARKSIAKLDKFHAMNRITTTTDYSGLTDAGLVIEAVFEDLELKRSIVKDVEQHAGDDTIFASNTSALPIADIATAAAHPERVIGMHYFSPVERMPLLEIIVTEKTADWVTASCVEFGRRQGKTVIVINDGPGFYTTRILAPFMSEAMHMLREGVPVEEIDAALKQLGFPVGPVKLLDEVGIDVAAHISESLHQAFGERMAPVEGMTHLAEDDRKGKKNGRGFYQYGAGDKDKVDDTVYQVLDIIAENPQLPRTKIAQRCLLQMVNEAAHCLADGILRQPRDGDIGAIFGLGFPPYLGGPFGYVDATGAADIVNQLKELEAEHGARFAPAPSLVEMAENPERRFYPKESDAETET